MAIDVAGWKQEVLAIEQYLKTFGDRTPSVLYQELAKTDSQLA